MVAWRTARGEAPSKTMYGMREGQTRHNPDTETPPGGGGGGQTVRQGSDGYGSGDQKPDQGGAKKKG